MTTPPGMAKTYTGVTYRLLDEDGHLVEQVTVPVGSYEDTRLGLEVIDGKAGWELVQPAAQTAEPAESDEPAEDAAELESTPDQPGDPEVPMDELDSPDPTNEEV